MKKSSLKTVQIFTYTFVPNIFGLNNIAIGRYKQAIFKQILFWISIFLFSLALLGLVIYLIISIFSAGQADIQNIYKLLLIPTFIACGFLGVLFIWAIWDIVVLAIGKQKDCNGEYVNNSWKGYTYMTRKERKIKRRQRILGKV